MSRRPMWITSNRIGETTCCSGIRATGRASATGITVSRHETRIIHRSTSIERSSQPLTHSSDQHTRGGLPQGMGRRQPAGGGSKSSQASHQETVGPSRVKIRKICSPPPVWVPINGRFYCSGFTKIFQKTSKFRSSRILLV